VGIVCGRVFQAFHVADELAELHSDEAPCCCLAVIPLERDELALLVLDLVRSN
jgi:hypothetical protein